MLSNRVYKRCHGGFGLCCFLDLSTEPFDRCKGGKSYLSTNPFERCTGGKSYLSTVPFEWCKGGKSYLSPEPFGRCEGGKCYLSMEPFNQRWRGMSYLSTRTVGGTTCRPGLRVLLMRSVMLFTSPCGRSGEAVAGARHRRILISRRHATHLPPAAAASHLHCTLRTPKTD